MKTSQLLIIGALLVLSSCAPVGPGGTSVVAPGDVVRLEDFVYEKEIKTVRIHPQGSPLDPAVTTLSRQDLILEFDDIASDRDNYNVQIIHCNHDWTRSGLQDLDFMRDYNDFPINNSLLSADTHVNYVHYWFSIPPVKLPGNYVLVVHRGSDKEDLILSRRFMVYDPRVSFSRDGKLVGPGSIADLNQQINFTVSHSGIEILNPMMDVHVNIRQNQRWDNYVHDIKPSFVREHEKELEYRFFDESKMFRGGNEFRFFDLRSLNNPGRNVDFVDRQKKPYEVHIARDKTRRHEAYSQYDEMNGSYLIDNYDFRDAAYTQYAYVNFTLASSKVDGEVYVIGAFTDWRNDKNNLMVYDSTKNQYSARFLLKQGWYDYQYYVKSNTLPPYYLEGSHFETENMYEAFVYYRPLQPRADLLIGYMRLEENPR